MNAASDDDSDSDERATPEPAVPADWAARLIAFWFAEHGASDWFGGGTEFDAKVAVFAPWREALRSQPAPVFTGDPATALAAIILFDQVPRNVFRGTAEAFATDDHARAIVRGVLAAGHDAGLSIDQRLFVYLPFEHSEDGDDQRESVRLISALGDDAYTRFAMMHAKVIDEFGRFPHRNAALGRADRPGEAAAVAAGAAF